MVISKMSFVIGEPDGRSCCKMGKVNWSGGSSGSMADSALLAEPLLIRRPASVLAPASQVTWREEAIPGEGERQTRLGPEYWIRPISLPCEPRNPKIGYQAVVR